MAQALCELAHCNGHNEHTETTVEQPPTPGPRQTIALRPPRELSGSPLGPHFPMDTMSVSKDSQQLLCKLQHVRGRFQYVSPYMSLCVCLPGPRGLTDPEDALVEALVEALAEARSCCRCRSCCRFAA